VFGARCGKHLVESGLIVATLKHNEAAFGISEAAEYGPSPPARPTQLLQTFRAPGVYTTFLDAWVRARRQLQQLPEEVKEAVVAALTAAQQQEEDKRQQQEGQQQQQEQHEEEETGQQLQHKETDKQQHQQEHHKQEQQKDRQQQAEPQQQEQQGQQQHRLLSPARAAAIRIRQMQVGVPHMASLHRGTPHLWPQDMLVPGTTTPGCTASKLSWCPCPLQTRL
jgi:outer membrane biosynthesis protein TonB